LIIVFFSCRFLLSLADVTLRKGAKNKREGQPAITLILDKEGGLEGCERSKKEALSPEGLRRSRNGELASSAADKRPAAKTKAKSVDRPYAHPYFWGGFIYTGL